MQTGGKMVTLVCVYVSVCCVMCVSVFCMMYDVCSVVVYVCAVVCLCWGCYVCDVCVCE